MNDKKMIILGLDGLNFELIDRYCERGFLPNIAGLMKGGTRRVLKSSMPFNTPCAWTTFQTGKSVGTHKVSSFMYPGKNLEDIQVFSGQDIKHRFFHELMDDLDVCLVNLPYSFPPRKKNLSVVGSWLSPAGSVYPAELAHTVPELEDYRIMPQKGLRERKKYDAYIDDIIDVEEKRFAAVQKLLQVKPWDLFFVLFSGTDWMQHAFYADLLEALPESRMVAFYKNIDRYVGRIRKDFPDRNLILMSDHGFTECRRFFMVNSWLHREGYLASAGKKKAGSGLLAKVFESSNPASRLLAKTYFSVKALFPFLKVEETKPRIPGSSAYCIDNTSWGIHLNDEPRFENGKLSDDGARLKEEIINKLTELKDPKTGKGIFSDICGKEKLGLDANETILPDVFFVMKEHYTKTHRLSRNNICFLDSPEGYTGVHSPYGIFVAHGPDIRSGCVLDNADIVDLPSTILHAFGRAVPAEFEGKILKDIFKEDSRLYKKDVEKKDIPTTLTDADLEEGIAEDITDQVKDRLKSLGYLD